MGGVHFRDKSAGDTAAGDGGDFDFDLWTCVVLLIMSLHIPAMDRRDGDESRWRGMTPVLDCMGFVDPWLGITEPNYALAQVVLIFFQSSTLIAVLCTMLRASIISVSFRDWEGFGDPMARVRMCIASLVVAAALRRCMPSCGCGLGCRAMMPGLPCNFELDKWPVAKVCHEHDIWFG